MGTGANLFPPVLVNDPAAVQRLFVHDTFPWQLIQMRLWESPRMFLQLRTRLLLNTHVQVGTPRMDWVALPVLSRVRNPIYCFLSDFTNTK